VVLGDEDEPASAYPLPFCGADCDYDFDCADDLVCFQRDLEPEVPGCTGQPLDYEDYCIARPTPTTLSYKYDEDKPTSFQNYKLGLCEGDCDSDTDCEEGLSCFQRSDVEAVPGCDGAGLSGKDYCYDARKPLTTGTGPVLGQCEGNCATSNDCDWGLNCFERTGTEAVPSCSGEGVSGNNYCYTPPPGELVISGNNNDPASAFPLQLCEGDCDEDFDCDGDMICLQRNSGDPVGECTGTPQSSNDYCVSRPSPTFLIYKYDDDEPTSFQNYKLGECEGDCDSDDDCQPGLVCFQRDGFTDVPGCSGSGDSSRDYCIRVIVDVPTEAPVTRAPTPPVPSDVTYRPGEATVFMAGLKLSTGLSARVIAETGTKVQFDTGGESTKDFHTVPDGAGVFLNEETGGYAYVTNSEDSDINYGGVGAIYFNAQGQVTGYEHLLGLDPANGLPQTRRNCAGGKTYWG
jgi:hypothetical protein